MAINLPPIGALQQRGSVVPQAPQSRGRVLAAGAPSPAGGGLGRGLAGLGQGMAALGEVVQQSRQQANRKAAVERMLGLGTDARNAAMAANGGPTPEAAAAMQSSPIQNMGIPPQAQELLRGLYDAGEYDAAFNVMSKFALASPEGGDAFTLAPGQVRYDANGRVIATGPDKPADAKDTYRTLSRAEAQQMGLPVDRNQAYQVGSDGKVLSIGSGGVTVNTGDVYNPSLEAQKTYGKINADTLTAIPSALQQVEQNASSYNQLEKAMDEGAIQGPFAESRLMLSTLGAMLGIEGLEQASGATEMMRSITNRLAPGLRPEGSGPMSDADLRLFLNSLPNIGITDGGNRKILGYLRKINNYQRQVLRARREYLSKAENFVSSPADVEGYVNEVVKSPFTDEDRQYFSSLSGSQSEDTLGTTPIETPNLNTTGQMGRNQKDLKSLSDQEILEQLRREGYPIDG